MRRSLIISMVLTTLVFSFVYAQEEEVPSYSIKDYLGKIIEGRRIVRVKIQNLIGLGYLNRGRIDEALAVFEKALENAREIPGAELGRTYRYIGFTYSIKGEYTKAIDYLKEAVKYNPEDAEAHTLLGSAYYFTDNLDGAISQYKRVKKLDPNLLRARYYLILDYEQKGKIDRMMREAKELVRDHLQYGPGHLGLARAYRRKKMYKKALKPNQTAVTYAPYFFHAHNNLAFTYNSLGEHRKAEEIRKRAWEIKPLSPPQRIVVGYTPLGFSFLRKKDFDNAIAEFGQAISMTPSDTRAYLGLVEAYLGRRKVDMALEVTGEIWKISPDSFAAYSILRKVYWYETKRRLREVIGLAFGRVFQVPERPIEAVTGEKKVEPKVAKEYSYEKLKQMVEYNYLRSNLYWGIKYLKRPRTPEEHFKYAFRIKDDIERYITYPSYPYPEIRESETHPGITIPPQEVMDARLSQVQENKRWQKRIDRAIKSYREVIDKYPESNWSDDAQYFLPGLYYLQGNYKKQIDEMRKFIEKHPYYKSQELEDWTRQQPTMKNLPRITKLTKNLSGLAQFGIGMTYARNIKDFQQAVIEFNKVIDNYPQEVSLIYLAAHNIERLCGPEINDYEPAIKAYQKVIEKHPESRHAIFAYRSIGYRYEKLEKYGEAIKTFQKILQIYPQDRRVPRAQYEIGSLYEKQKKYPQAIQAYQKVIDNYPKKKYLVEKAKKRIQELKSKGK